MNLSPDWVSVLQGAGHEAMHWFAVGAPQALDSDIAAHAAKGGWIVLTRDLDFGAALIVERAALPSVVQIRARLVSHDKDGPQVLAALAQFGNELRSGALLTLHLERQRVRVLRLPVGQRALDS